MNSLGRYFFFFFFFFFAISAKEDNFCDFLFALLNAKLLLNDDESRFNKMSTHKDHLRKPLLKRGLLYKERICSLWEQILSLQSRPFSEGDKTILTVLSPLKVYQFLITMAVSFIK